MNSGEEKRMWRNLLRKSRGWLYRRLPAFIPGLHRLRVAGFNRRWDMENRGWTQEGFACLVWEKILRGRRRGRILECACGGGLIGSLGWWLEKNAGWTADCEEHRKGALAQLQIARPMAKIHSSLAFLGEAGADKIGDFDLVTSRSCRDASRLFRMISRDAGAPMVVGIWNPSGRDHWSRRLAKLGYQLALCRDRFELYRKR
jgi:hypothetical protein